MHGVREELQRLRASGERVLLVIPHVLGIDMTGAVLSALAPGASMMKAPSNLSSLALAGSQPFWRKDLHETRLAAPGQGDPGGHVYLMPDEDLDGARLRLCAILRDPDRDLAVVGRIARMTGAKVMPVFCIDNGGRYHVTIGQPLSEFPSGISRRMPLR